jgi:hypothetical protein
MSTQNSTVCDSDLKSLAHVGEVRVWYPRKLGLEELTTATIEFTLYLPDAFKPPGPILGCVAGKGLSFACFRRYLKLYSPCIWPQGDSHAGSRLKASLLSCFVPHTLVFRSPRQAIIDVAGPPKDEALMNCNALANGWIFTNVITAEAQAAVRAVHERQWGPPKRGQPKDK